jgi:hypothetical protein
MHAVVFFAIASTGARIESRNPWRELSKVHPASTVRPDEYLKTLKEIETSTQALEPALVQQKHGIQPEPGLDSPIPALRETVAKPDIR